MKRLTCVAIVLLACACNGHKPIADPCAGPKQQAAQLKSVNTLTWAAVVEHDPQCFGPADLNLAYTIKP